MCVIADKGAYVKRLAFSSGMVGAALLPGVICLGARGIAISWSGILLLMDSLTLFRHVDVPAAVGVAACAAGTLSVLALAANRLLASILATVWFVLNALGGWVLLATFRLEAAG